MSAREIYDSLTFTNPDGFFQKPAPNPLVTLSIGGVLLFISFIWWIHRTNKIFQHCEIKSVNTLVRSMISAAIDRDKNLFVMTSYSATSFLFLGGLQLNYDLTLLTMIGFYTLVASLESIRILFAFCNKVECKDIFFSSKILESDFKKLSGKELSPKNVYEDLGRRMAIVFMVFVTQVILISFVFIDMTKTKVSKCLDGTAGCPVTGTLGSWSFFVLGIFMALVFQLGPKTNYGKSEQNPAYWLRLFVELRQHATFTYIDEAKADKLISLDLRAEDYRVLLRFFMSFIINGVGYYVLVHALPLQVAAQTSLTGVVFRAVGMMYLVDLDDTPGYKLTITREGDVDAKDSEELSIKQAIAKTRVLLKELEELAQKKQREEQLTYVTKKGYSSISSEVI